MAKKKTKVSREYKTAKTHNKEKIIREAIKNGDIEDYARAGATDKTIASALGMSEDTWYKYKKTIPELSEALMRGRKPVVLKVMGAMVKRAIGFEYEESMSEIREVFDKNTGEVVTLKSATKYKRYCPPETNAGNRVLMNYVKHAQSDIPDEWHNDPSRTELQERSVTVQERKEDRAEEDDY